MNRSSMLALAAITSVVLLACEKTDPNAAQGKSPTETTNAQTQGTPAAKPETPPAPAPIVLNDTDLATPADFEEDAEKAITTKNYKVELASLEADVAKD